MIELTQVQINEWVGQFIWPLSRITAFMLAAPIFGTQVVSSRIRLVLGLSLTILIAPLLPPLPPFDGLSLSLVMISLQQVLIGVTLAFIFQVVFQVFILTGQFVAMKMGLGFASMNDPANGVTVTIISQFYLLATTLLFLSINGHLILMEVLVLSFSEIPIEKNAFGAGDLFMLASWGSWMFSSALSIALPVLTALLIVNISFGIMSRSAPQINIFAVGFPITLIFGLFLLWIGFPDFLAVFQEVLDQGYQFSLDLMR